MPQFRKKPVVIEAWKVSDLLRCARESWKELPETIRAVYETGVSFSARTPYLLRRWKGK